MNSCTSTLSARVCSMFIDINQLVLLMPCSFSWLSLIAPAASRGKRCPLCLMLCLTFNHPSSNLVSSLLMLNNATKANHERGILDAILLKMQLSLQSKPYPKHEIYCHFHLLVLPVKNDFPVNLFATYSSFNLVNTLFSHRFPRGILYRYLNSILPRTDYLKWRCIYLYFSLFALLLFNRFLHHFHDRKFLRRSPSCRF